MGLALDTAGWVGAVLVLIAYVLVSVRRLSATARSFQALNIAGGVLLGSTALYRGVFPVTVVNLVWIVVGAYALAATRKRRVPEDATPEVREQVAGGLVNLGITLGLLDRGPEAVDAYRDLVTRYGEDATPEVRKRVAGGLVNLGITLGQLDRGPEAVDAYRDLVTRYGEDATPDVREQVARGLVNLGNDEGSGHASSPCP